MKGLVLVHPEHALVKSCKEAFPDLDVILGNVASSYLERGSPVYALCHGDFPEFLPEVKHIRHPGSDSSVGRMVFDQGFTIAASRISEELERLGIKEVIIGGLYHGACCNTMRSRLVDKGIETQRNRYLTDLQYL